ncbi:TetR/AcrR family transcriptional regulator [Planctomycetota bacterium]|nr:TetR/AcrR family transcriptional regulator [Planctomycetota bacterium]
MARKKLTATQRRAQLIDVGRKAFADKGFEATSVEHIAEQAGVSKPIVYQHFGGKDGLYQVIVEQEMSQVAQVISEAIGTGSARERTERAVLAFLTYVRDNTEGFAVLSHDAPVASGRGCMSSLINDLAGRVGHVFEGALRDAGGYDPAAAPIYAHALVGMVSFVGQWWADNQEQDMDAVAGHLTALAWLGLRRLPLEPERPS